MGDVDQNNEHLRPPSGEGRGGGPLVKRPSVQKHLSRLSCEESNTSAQMHVFGARRFPGGRFLTLVIRVELSVSRCAEAGGP